MGHESLEYFESKAAVGLGDQRNLMLVKTAMYNAIIAESNGRASFAGTVPAPQGTSPWSDRNRGTRSRQKESDTIQEVQALARR